MFYTWLENKAAQTWRHNTLVHGKLSNSGSAAVLGSLPVPGRLREQHSCRPTVTDPYQWIFPTNRRGRTLLFSRENGQTNTAQKSSTKLVARGAIVKWLEQSLVEQEDLGEINPRSFQLRV